VFKKIAEKFKKLKELAANKPDVDPAVFNDPVAMQTEWNAASKGSGNFQIHKLRQLYDDSIEYVPTLGLKLSSALFALVGLGVIAIVIVAEVDSGGRALPWLVGIPFGSVFLAAGLGIYYSNASPIVFDKHSGFFWKGRKRPHEVFDTSVIKCFAQLNEIHALQLLRFWASGGSNSSGYCYHELNLVLKEGKRINVVTYAKKGKLREDAAILSEFLGVPVWDAIE